MVSAAPAAPHNEVFDFRPMLHVRHLATVLHNLANI
jgi:hypothetical protein